MANQRTGGHGMHNVSDVYVSVSVSVLFTWPEITAIVYSTPELICIYGSNSK